MVCRGMIVPTLRVVLTSRVRRIKAALAALVVFSIATLPAKLNDGKTSGGGGSLLDDPPVVLVGRTSPSISELWTVHKSLPWWLPSGNGFFSSEYYKSPIRRGGSTSSSPTTYPAADEEDSSNQREYLPKWITEYASWHAQQLKQINESNWREFKYLVFWCHEKDRYECGGASDRIHPIPFGLLLANQTQRIILIDWTRPCRLEEFLVPPSNEINWTVPSFVEFEYWSNPVLFAEMHIQNAFGDSMLVGVKYRVGDYGQIYYDANRGDPSTEPDFVAVYHNVWKLFFMPSPAVASLVHEAQQSHSLVPDQYVSVHVRAMYKLDRSGEEEMVRNAIHCGAQLRPGFPIFFASDSPNVSSYAIMYGRQIGVKVSAQLSDTPPLHLDRGSNFLAKKGTDGMSRNASDFYDTFVDLYLLAGGACTAFNVGGYGQWARNIGSNTSCYIDHRVTTCDYPGGNITSSA